ARPHDSAVTAAASRPGDRVTRARPTRPTPHGSACLCRARSPGVGPAALGTADLAALLGPYWTDRGRDGAPGLRPSTDPLRRARLAGDVLHERDGALADECDRHRVGAHALARDT